MSILKRYLEKSLKVIKNIKLNKSPLLQSYKLIKFVNTHENLSENDLLERAKVIKQNSFFNRKNFFLL